MSRLEVPRRLPRDVLRTTSFVEQFLKRLEQFSFNVHASHIETDVWTRNENALLREDRHTIFIEHRLNRRLREPNSRREHVEIKVKGNEVTMFPFTKFRVEPAKVLAVKVIELSLDPNARSAFSLNHAGNALVNITRTLHLSELIPSEEIDMHIYPPLNRRNLRIYPSLVQERLHIALPEDRRESLAQRRQAGQARTKLRVTSQISLIQNERRGDLHHKHRQELLNQVH